MKLNHSDNSDSDAISMKFNEREIIAVTYFFRVEFVNVFFLIIKGIEPEVVEQPTNSSFNSSANPQSSYTSNVCTDHRSYHSTEQIYIPNILKHGKDIPLSISISNLLIYLNYHRN